MEAAPEFTNLQKEDCITIIKRFYLRFVFVEMNTRN